jgi:SAM-dependent methyltransferase
MVDRQPEDALFDLGSVFEVDDYLFVYQSELTDERSDQEVASLVRLLQLESPMRILDLACGFGRHTNRLAALGHSVTGVDIVPGFLALAQAGAAELGVQVDYLSGDMRRISFREAFDRVLLLFTSFGYFEDQGNEQVVKNMVRALKPGGCLLFDIPNRDVMLKNLPPAEVIDRGDDLVINRFAFDPPTGRLHNRRVPIRDGIRKDKPFSIRLYNSAEVATLLRQAGVEDFEILGEHGQLLSGRSQRMVVIGRKQGREA